MSKLPDPSSPRILGEEYVLGDILGIGGMGIVYSATQPRLWRTVAVKVLRPEHIGDDRMHKRFCNEALAGSRLSHPNIAAVIDFVRAPDGTMYLVMEHVRGQRLGRIVHESGPLPVRRAALLCGQILAALDETHAAGIVHADVKSDNVLVETLRDGREVAKLIDFGLARFPHSADAGDAPMLSGTPAYLAPEVILGGTPSPVADLYGTGVILYELLVGAPPFTGMTSNEVFAKHLNDPVIAPSARRRDRAISPNLDAVVLRALAKSADARFPDALSFANALFDAARIDDPTSPMQRTAFSPDAPTGEWTTIRDSLEMPAVR
jgi:eukaryotic-like serine/threonine-protein kinase